MTPKRICLIGTALALALWRWISFAHGDWADRLSPAAG